MKVEQNIGILNALIRITIGLTLLSWGSAKMVWRPWRNSYLFLILCGAMKVAEGIVRYCPITALLQKEPCCIPLKLKPDKVTNDTENTDEPLAYNPT